MDALEKYILENKDKLDIFPAPKFSEKEFLKRTEDNLTRFIMSHKSDLDTEEPSDKVWEALEGKLDTVPFDKMLENQQEMFDIHEPPAGLWDNISEELDKDEVALSVEKTEEATQPKTVSLQTLWKVVAAAVLFGVMVGGVLHQQYFKPVEQVAEVELPTELQQAEQHYISMISLKKQEVKGYEWVDPSMISDFDIELHNLNKNYQGLKKELIQQKNNQVIIRAMVNNLQKQMDLLNKQLTILEQVNKQRSNHETTDL